MSKTTSVNSFRHVDVSFVFVLAFLMRFSVGVASGRKHEILLVLKHLVDTTGALRGGSLGHAVAVHSFVFSMICSSLASNPHRRGCFCNKIEIEGNL